MDYRAKAAAFLNANFQPWDFNGEEPCTIALAALLQEVADNATASPRGAGAVSGASDEQAAKCSHCGWSNASHRGPGCPCAMCGEYGHRWVDCATVRSQTPVSYASSQEEP